MQMMEKKIFLIIVGWLQGFKGLPLFINKIYAMKIIFRKVYVKANDVHQGLTNEIARLLSCLATGRNSIT
jgi:hypothetical protein